MNGAATLLPPPATEVLSVHPPRLAPLVVKTCSCGLSHTAEDWESLRNLGLQDAGDGFVIELRDCLCKSTIAVEVTVDTDGTIWRWQS
jgi:hypothetical protein